MMISVTTYQGISVCMYGEDEQVKTLFHDILIACQANKDLYYIGGIITVKYPKIENCFDLVDGQQRFTTMWLLANELGEAIKGFTRTSNGLRLNFSIRKNVEAYFNQLLTSAEAGPGTNSNQYSTAGS